MWKKVVAWTLCLLLMVLFGSISVGANYFGIEYEEITEVDGVRWFPCPPEKQNDDAWEVECLLAVNGYKGQIACQRFTETVEDTGYANFLDTVYGEDGSLTITRNGNDKVMGVYSPCIRTITLECAPLLDLKTADTLYFNFDVADGTEWAIMLSNHDDDVLLNKAIAEAVGITSLKSSDEDGPSGHFEGAINLQDALAALAEENETASSEAAKNILNTDKTHIPQLTIFCVGPVGASMTIREMYISTAEDTAGERCLYADMNLLASESTIVCDWPDEDFTSSDDTDTNATAKAEEEASVDTTWIIAVTIGAVCVVAVAAIAALLLLKRSKRKDS